MELPAAIRKKAPAMATSSPALGRPDEAADRTELASALLPLVGAALAFVLVKQGTDLVAREAQELVFLWLAPVALITLAMALVRVAALATAPRVFARGGAVFLALYLTLEPFAIPYATMAADHPAVQFHSHARWVAAALAALGWWRLGGLFGASAILWMMRELQPALTGFYFSTLDIRTAYESFAFFALGIGLAHGLSARAGWRERLRLTQEARARAAMFVLAGAIGAHLGNYFYSGLAKLTLDGGVLSWLLDNELYAGVPGALEKGTLVTAGFPLVTQGLYDAMVLLWLPMNGFALLIQLFAPIAVHKRRWLIWTTIGYDVFHVAVYVALGLFFWKWIAVNTIIVVTLARTGDGEWDAQLRRCCLVFMLAGPLLFRIATLAWYDAPGFGSSYFQAQLEDGRVLRVPNAWFLSSSYQVSQGRMFWPEGEAAQGHFNPSIWGSVLTHADLMAGRECRAPASPVAGDASYGTLAELANFVRLQHAIMQRRRLDYRLLPHHHMPSPFLADPFVAVPPGEVRRYDLVLESVCLSLDKGQLKRQVLKRDVWPLYEPGSGKLLQ